MLGLERWYPRNSTRGFPGSSVGKESTCNAGDLDLIPGLGRSPGEGKGYLLQCSWASLVAQLVKNPPAMWETWVQSLGWEVPLKEDRATHSSILAWRIPMDRGAWRATVNGVTKSDMTEQLSTAQEDSLVGGGTYLEPGLLALSPSSLHAACFKLGT